jgi:acetolactate synthase I/II/III large subunit
MIKVSDIVIDKIADTGVGHVFFVPGGGAMHLNDSLGRNARLQYVGNLHEQASSIAAEAYSKASGNFGVCMVTTGPGGTNAVTGVAGAWLDSTPMLFVSGQVKRADLSAGLGVRQVGVQEVDIVSIVKPITKYAVTVLEPESIRYHMEKAVHIARTGRPGPVWVDVPLDVQGAKVDAASLKGFEPEEPRVVRPANLEELVARTIALLEKAERPVLLAGNGIRLSRAVPELEELVEKLGIPVLQTWLGLDMIPEAHPLYMGRPGAVAPRGSNFAVQNADFLLTVGARLDLVITGYSHPNFARAAKKVMVDIDPAELAKMKTPIDIPICSDAGAFLRELLRQWGTRAKKENGAWLDRCRGWKAKYPIIQPSHLKETGPTSIYALADLLSDALPDGETVVSGSSGAGIEIFLHAYRVRKGQRILHTTALGAMGFGLPMAIGACVARGGKRTVLVDGDGGFQFNIQELETVRRMNLPLKMFVLNNDGYSSIRTSQRGYFGQLVGADATSGLTLPDLRRQGDAWGVSVRRIESFGDLKKEIAEILADPRPTIIDLVVHPEEERLPRIASKPTASGSMVSTPLEDLYPYLPREEFRSNMIIPPLEGTD